MITLKELIHATADTIKIDWLKVEETIGFPLHYDLKISTQEYYVQNKNNLR